MGPDVTLLWNKSTGIEMLVKSWLLVDTLSVSVQDPDAVVPVHTNPAWTATGVPIPNAAPKAMVLTAPRRLYFIDIPILFEPVDTPVSHLEVSNLRAKANSLSFSMYYGDAATS
jgi:hypothetical protein